MRLHCQFSHSKVTLHLMPDIVVLFAGQLLWLTVDAK